MNPKQIHMAIGQGLGFASIALGAFTQAETQEDFDAAIQQTVGSMMNGLPAGGMTSNGMSGGIPPSVTSAPGPRQPSGGTGVSFTRDVAPWMVKQCGNCHINNQKGGVSLATYTAIMKGGKDGAIIVAGNPSSSRLLQSIESGSMPPQGTKVSQQDIGKLKQWIQEGAKFDGQSPDAPIR